VNSPIIELWPTIVLTADIAAASAVTIDAVLRKRHVPSVIGWVGLAWLAPILGSILYLCFGINRIERTAAALNLKAAWAGDSEVRARLRHAGHRAQVATRRHPTFTGLARLGQRVTRNQLIAGNRVALLNDGDDAFPAMLAAIDGARASVALLTYIFDSDAVGGMFLAALARAAKRDVQVRVLVDDFGARYTRPSMIKRLRAAGIRVAAFLPTRAPHLFRYANLRNHRKILVVDGAVGFTGGMNIREGHWLARNPTGPVHCLHFRVEGPVVADLQRTFAIDWAFTTGEHLKGELWFPRLEACGTVASRGVRDGPDADLDNIVHIMLGALSVATRRVRIVTPYFLPDGVLLRALQVAALRGVHVDIVLPAKSNIPIMDWAMAPQFGELLGKGCRVHFTPPPFDHTKLLVADGFWSLIGSTNWDARSLRLNFEYNLECYDEALAAQLDVLVEDKIARAHRLQLHELQTRPFAIRLRNGLARLLSPYL
jgi:cardiolipin synthase